MANGRNTSPNDVYAGDEAWLEWFELCSVSRCAPAFREALSRQVGSAMIAQLTRAGFSPADVEGDDPVACFDAYFQLKGSRDPGKPLKRFFLDRIRRDGLVLRDFVCGTLFGSRSGRVHDIVRDWISTVKGWRPHSLTAPDGTRHLVWEAAAAADDVREAAGSVQYRPGTAVDRQVLRLAVRQMLDAVSAKMKVEKPTVALLFYVTALELPVTDPQVLERLGVAKTRAYTMRNRCMEMAQEFFRGKEVDQGDALFARVLFSVCAAAVRPEDDAVLAPAEGGRA